MSTRKLLIGIAAATLAVTGAVADMRNHDNELTAKKIGKSLIQTKAGAINFTGTTDQQITASSNIDIGNKKGFFVVTFSGESNCSGDANNWCVVKILCDNVEASPVVGGDFAFDSVGPASSTSTWHSLSVTRRSDAVVGGAHSCQARTQQTSAGTTLRLDDWTFTVQFWQQ